MRRKTGSYVTVLAVIAVVFFGGVLFFSIPSKGYVFEYRLADGSHLFLAGKDLDTSPEDIFIVNALNECVYYKCSARKRTDAHRKYAACGVHPAQETNQNANVLFVSYIIEEDGSRNGVNVLKRARYHVD